MDEEEGECRWCGKKITKTPTERRGKEINMRKSWKEDYYQVHDYLSIKETVFGYEIEENCSLDGKQMYEKRLGLRPHQTLIRTKGCEEE